MYLMRHTKSNSNKAIHACSVGEHLVGCGYLCSPMSVWCDQTLIARLFITYVSDRPRCHVLSNLLMSHPQSNDLSNL